MLKQKNLLLLWAALQTGILLLLQQAFSGWIIGVFLLLLLYRVDSVLRNRPTLSLKWVNLLAGLVAIALFVNLRQAGVLHFMLQILLLAAVARLLALQHLYEARQLVWVHYFLTGCCFILHQDMAIAMLVFAVFLLNLYSHYRLFAPTGAQLNWPQTGRAVLIILPLWLGMFLLFPRLPAFWQIPDANVAATGLGDSIDPGSIEKLVQDDSLAFRVEFDGPLPPRQQLYWRARLYEEFDGRSWHVSAMRRTAARYTPPATATEKEAAQQSYSVIAEASRQTSLYALARPLSVSGSVRLNAGGLVSANKPLSQRLSYRVNGIYGPAALLSEQEQQLNLAPGAANPATKQFAAELLQQYPQPAQLVQALTEHFSSQPFYYSLTPPLLPGANSVDQFLFNSRTGFCSHYASASAVILRAAGIAARVVGGYQGGQWHPQQNYLAVRQREAHAWVEYLDNGVWQQFDPTAAVAPERILNNLDDILPQEQRNLLSSGWRQLAFLQAARQQLMHLDYYWSVWVLGFNDNSQQQLWRQLKQQLPVIAAAAAIVLLLTGIVIGRHLLTRRQHTLPAATLLLHRALRPLLAQKQPTQPVSAYLRQLAASQTQHSAWLQQLADYYEQAVYAEQPQALAQLAALLKRRRRQVKQLRSSIKNA
ncbi:transglutaminase family protein [Rheinheimera sp. NSM]|uniref:transglutaminase family protein n=1 Tax=Rheinheimera sp. NSM TaxID=3457884 RepID=UPI0040367889